MAMLTNEVVDQAFRAVDLLVRLGADTAMLRQDISHAESAVRVALSQNEARIRLLERVVEAHELGTIPDAAYRNVLATIGRLLKASTCLTSELARITVPQERR